VEIIVASPSTPSTRRLLVDFHTARDSAKPNGVTALCLKPDNLSLSASSATRKLNAFAGSFVRSTSALRNLPASKVAAYWTTTK